MKQSSERILVTHAGSLPLLQECRLIGLRC